jgi:hypothetical protein
MILKTVEWRVSAGRQQAFKAAIEPGQKGRRRLRINGQVPPVIGGKGAALHGVFLSHHQWQCRAEIQLRGIELGMVDEGMGNRAPV